MQILEILAERINNIDLLKNKVKSQIDLTDDETLLNRVFTSLNSGTLMQRLSAGLGKLSDPEINTFLKDISNAIINADGSYEEKMAFIDGLHKGFVDVNKMIDGSRHHFSDLLVPNKKVSLQFLFGMFNSLKDLGGKAKKGPGEFSLAIMSPDVSVFGGGDLKINGKFVEVKAGAGTIGATGMFQHQKVPIILQQFFPNIDTTRNMGAVGLAKTLTQYNLDKSTLKAFADKFVDYIFKSQEEWANTDPLKAAIQNPQSPTLADDIRRGYLTASYSAYKGQTKSEKFHGIMLMNFDKQELRYFEDPTELYNDIDTVAFNFVSKNKEWGGKLINPGVTLRSQPLARPAVPDNANDKSMQNYIDQQADFFIKRSQQRNPRDLSLRDPKLKIDVANTIKGLAARNTAPAKMTAEILARFPMLKVRAVQDATNAVSTGPQI